MTTAEPSPWSLRTTASPRPPAPPVTMTHDIAQLGQRGHIRLHFIGGIPYLPCHTAGRFSANAVAPSRASCDAKTGRRIAD